jgi:hypothetical protein
MHTKTSDGRDRTNRNFPTWDDGIYLQPYNLERHLRIITIHPVTCLAFYDVSSPSAEAGTTCPCDTTCCK